jgi:hypothetical protein
MENDKKYLLESSDHTRDCPDDRASVHNIRTRYNDYSDDMISDFGHCWYNVLGEKYPKAFAHSAPPFSNWSRQDMRTCLNLLPDFEIIGMGF